LLQGPGSEFSLANPDLDLELDYYDYNVVNAGAAPGSYLGMDPAFLVWIPPLTEDEVDLDFQQEEEPQYEEISERSICLDTEGFALSPTQYRKVRESRTEDSSDNDWEDVIKPRKLDPGECRLHDEIIMEYKARLGEGMLPIHKILEESKVRVSEDSLSSTSDIIPNRLDTKGKMFTRERFSRNITKSSSYRNQNKQAKITMSSESSTQSLDTKETDLKSSKTAVNDLDILKTGKQLRNLDRDYCEVNILSNTISFKTSNISRRHQDVIALNAIHDDDKKRSENIVNIPLAEISRNRIESPVKVHCQSSNSNRNVSIHSPNYGVSFEEINESYYDIIGKNDGIKFADDDDEYIDNKDT
jgi:hypothetical protein